MPSYQRLPVAFAYGEGAWLVDQAGRRYLDALGGIAVCCLGHAHPQVRAALSEQAGLLVHTSNLYQVPLQEQLAQRLCKLSGLDKVFFANSGAEANEAAIKLSRLYGHKKRGLKEPVIIVMSGSFHGRTLATLSATDSPQAREGFAPLVPGFHQIAYNDIDALSALRASDEEIVAVMLEPIQGEGGIVIPAPGYLRAVRKICTERGWLMVLDEIQSGMCRTGKWFACQHEECRPDIITLAKSLGNGVPIGACMANAAVAECVLPGTHGSTFGGNPLVARTALAVVDYIQTQGLAARAAALGERILSGFHAELDGLEGVKQIRGKGLMIGIELARDCTALVERALDEQLLINVTAKRVVRLLPPLIISDAQAEQIVAKVSRLIREFIAE